MPRALRICSRCASATNSKVRPSRAWNYRTLQRNIATQYYYRLLKAPDPDAVEAETNQKTLFYRHHGNGQVDGSRTEASL